VEYDHVYKLTWSPDSKAILGFKAMENCIEVYRVDKKDGLFTNYAKSVTFPRAHENDDIISLDISCNGKFILSASNKTELILWDVRGNILSRMDTFTMTNYAAKISPCGRFIAISGFAPDIALWEVKFNKTGGGYEKTIRAFELTGHSGSVWDFAFDQDGSHVLSVCKDGTFKLFDIKSELMNFRLIFN
jgi:mRNA-capping enzyme